jgi:hypothetical protein
MVTYPKAFLVLGAAVLAAGGAAALPVPEAHAATITPVAGGALAQQCRDGKVVVSGHGILTCKGGRWIYRDCPPGTAPRGAGDDHVVCKET